MYADASSRLDPRRLPGQPLGPFERAWLSAMSSPGAFGPAEATTWRSSGLEMGAIYGNLIDLTVILTRKDEEISRKFDKFS